MAETDLKSGARVPAISTAAISANVSLLWDSTWSPSPQPRDWVQGGHPETSHNFLFYGLEQGLTFGFF